MNKQLRSASKEGKKGLSAMIASGEKGEKLAQLAGISAELRQIGRASCRERV